MNNEYEFSYWEIRSILKKKHARQLWSFFDLCRFLWMFSPQSSFLFIIKLSPELSRNFVGLFDL